VRAVVRRLLTLVVVAWLVVTATFVVLEAAPGSVDRLLDDPALGPEAREVIRHRFGLDRPAHVRYLRWLAGLARGDLGISFLYRRPVAEVLGEALPPTALLAGTALLLDLAGGLALALLAAWRPGGWVDRVASLLALGLYGLPPFWLAVMALLVFSVTLGWFPPSHMHSVGAQTLPAAARLLDLIRHLALPALSLGLAGAAATGRYLRAALLEVRSARFLLAARARGVPPVRLLLVHALRPALLPVVTLLGLGLPALVSGSLVVEVVFSWPGMGQLVWRAATARDVPLTLAATLLAAGAVMVGTLVADLLYALVDPRVREAV